MDVAYLLLALVFALGAVIGIVLWTRQRKQTEQNRAALHEFALQVGGVEHTAPGLLRFGHFPDAQWTPGQPPFDYAIEFSRGTFDVLAFEKGYNKDAHGGEIRERRHRCLVELRVPQTPLLWLGPEVFAVQDLRLRSQIIPGLPGGEHHFVVASPDEEFARSVVTPEVANWVSTRLARYFMPIVLEDGTIRTKPLGERLQPEHILTATDQLIELVRLLPQHAWSRDPA